MHVTHIYMRINILCMAMGSSLSGDKPDPLECQHSTMHVCTPMSSKICSLWRCTFYSNCIMIEHVI